MDRSHRGRDDAAEPHAGRWEPSSVLDRLAVSLHQSIISSFRWILIITAFSILLTLVVVTGLGAVTDPVILAMVILSVAPALGLVAFIKLADVGVQEPLSILTVTFLLGLLLAVFAGILNGLGLLALSAIPVFSTLLFFYLVVGPVEEGIKLLAVRLFAYQHRRFDAVIDGAIYGAAAGLGFATIENALYITDSLAVLGASEPVIDAIAETTAVRALVGPGHVIYAAIAGFYLGLAKFNRNYAGPLIIKGLGIAAIIHSTYNAMVQVVPDLLAELFGVSIIGGLLFFIVIYDGLAAYYLYRLLAGYRRAYRDARGRGEDTSFELVEFDDR